MEVLLEKVKKNLKLCDRFGVLVSSLCVVHCILLPLVIIAFPTVTTALNLSEDVTHISLLLFLLPATVFAIYSGFKVHKQKAPLVYLGVGLFFVIVGTLFVHDWLSHQWEPFIVILGSICLVRGHLLNSHHCKKCEEEHHCVWESSHE